MFLLLSSHYDCKGHGLDGNIVYIALRVHMKCAIWDGVLNVPELDMITFHHKRALSLNSNFLFSDTPLSNCFPISFCINTPFCLSFCYNVLSFLCWKLWLSLCWLTLCSTLACFFVCRFVLLDNILFWS